MDKGVLERWHVGVHANRNSNRHLLTFDNSTHTKRRHAHGCQLLELILSLHKCFVDGPCKSPQQSLTPLLYSTAKIRMQADTMVRGS